MKHIRKKQIRVLIYSLSILVTFGTSEGIFYINQEQIYYRWFNNWLGMISETECVLNTGDDVEECNPHVLNLMTNLRYDYIRSDQGNNGTRD